MTYRERREARAARLEEWAEKRAAKADAASARFHDLIEHGPPMGEPIKVGHHSERAHRKHFDRLDSALGQAVEHGKMADSHESRAAGILSQLDRSIYSDDTDAIERLEERIAELETERTAIKARPHKSWELSNLAGSIRRYKQRLAAIRIAAERAVEGKPSRVTTARRAGTCDRCGEAIAIGAYIGQTGDEWSHVYADGDVWKRCDA